MPNHQDRSENVPRDKDDAAMQAECIVAAIDAYLATMPWPSPTIGQVGPSGSGTETKASARLNLSRTLAATIRMLEPRKIALKK